MMSRVPKARESIISKLGETEEIKLLLKNKANSEIIRCFCPSEFEMEFVLHDLCDTKDYGECKLCWRTAVALEENN